MKRILLIVSVLCVMTVTAGNRTNALKRCAGLIAAKTHRFNARRSAQNDYETVIKAFETVQEASEYGAEKAALIAQFNQELSKLKAKFFKAHNEKSEAILNEKMRVIAVEYADKKATLKTTYPKAVKVVPVDESLAIDLDAEATAV